MNRILVIRIFIISIWYVGCDSEVKTVSYSNVFIGNGMQIESADNQAKWYVFQANFNRKHFSNHQIEGNSESTIFGYNVDPMLDAIEFIDSIVVLHYVFKYNDEFVLVQYGNTHVSFLVETGELLGLGRGNSVIRKRNNDLFNENNTIFIDSLKVHQSELSDSWKSIIKLRGINLSN